MLSQNRCKCQICDKIITKVNIRRHQREVHQAPAMDCQLCGRGFSRRDRLELHIQRDHYD